MFYKLLVNQLVLHLFKRATRTTTPASWVSPFPPVAPAALVRVRDANGLYKSLGAMIVHDEVNVKQLFPLSRRLARTFPRILSILEDFIKKNVYMVSGADRDSLAEKRI